MAARSAILLGLVTACVGGLTGDDRPGGGGGKGDDPNAGSSILENADGRNDRFRGIGRFEGQAGTHCTAFLIDNGGAADAPAYVITNGHCSHDWAPYDSAVRVQLDTGGQTDARMLFDHFIDTAPTTIAVRAVPFATMKGVDLAVVELDVARAELEGQGIRALAWSAAPPTGAPIQVVGAPLADPGFLRLAECTARDAAGIIERNWSWSSTLSNRCPGISEGSSGSPVLDETGGVFAAINTTTRGQEEPAACYLGAPCEVGETGFHFAAETNYAMPLGDLRACFGEDGRFDLARSGCGLDPGRQLEALDLPYFRNRPDGVGGVPNRWEVRLAGAAGLTHFREKAGPAGQVRCEDPGGYSAPVALAGQDLAARAVGQEEGPHQLCILGGAGPSLDDWWQAPAFALPIVTYVDSTPPSQRPSFRTFVSEEAVATEPIFKLPELAGFSYVFGPASELDCSQPDLRWEPYRRFFIEIPSSVFPARLCVRAEDLAGNVGAPLGFEYP